MSISDFPMHFDPTVESIYAFDLMSTPVVSLQSGAQLHEVLDAVMASGLGTVPVLDNAGTVVALVTEESVAKAEMLGLWSGGVSWSDVTLAKRMTAAVFHFAEPAASVTIHTRLTDIVDVMLSKGLRAIPVVSNGQLCGMVSWRNIFAAMMRSHGG